MFPSLFFLQNYPYFLSLLYLNLVYLNVSFLLLILNLSSLFMDLLSEVEEVMEGAAPMDQSPQETPEGSSTDSTSTLPYSYDVSNCSSLSSSPVVSTFNSPSGVLSITTPPDIPIKVEYLSDPIPVPSLLFHFPYFSTSTSTPSSSSISTFHIPNVTNSPALAYPSKQDVSHPVPLFRPTPIIGSLYISQSLANPYPSSSFSFDMLPSLCSSITHDQNLPSCSFITPKIIPSFTSTSPVSSSILSPRKPRGRQLVRGKSSRGCSHRGKSPRGSGRGSRILSGHFSCSDSSSHNLSFSQSSPISSQRYLPGEGALDYLPDLGSVVTQNPTVNLFFTNYSCSPKVFSPIVSFNEPSEYMFNMFSFIYTYDFFPGQDSRSLLVSDIEQ